MEKDIDAKLARKKLQKKYGNNLQIVFGKIREDGTRSVKFREKGKWDWHSHSYLTDIRGDD